MQKNEIKVDLNTAIAHLSKKNMLKLKPFILILLVLILGCSLERRLSNQAIFFCEFNSVSETQAACCQETIEGCEPIDISDKSYCVICQFDCQPLQIIPAFHLQLPTDNSPKSISFDTMYFSSTQYLPKDALFLCNTNLNETYQFLHPPRSPYLKTIHTTLLNI